MSPTEQSLADRVKVLEDAIRSHRSQKADDRCIEDDDRLYEALGDGIKCDRRVGDTLAMLHNCKRFIENRCQAGGWPTYAQMENKLRLAMEAIEAANLAMHYGLAPESADAVRYLDLMREKIAMIPK